MALFLRLSGGKLASQLMTSERNAIFQAARTVTIKSYPVKPAVTADYDERNLKIGRPQSPHLTIYAPQLTSMLSITHRLSGVALAVYTSSIGIAALVAPKPLSQYVETLASLDIPSPVWLAVKFIFAFPFCYHTCNGVRHLFWDLGMFLTLKQVYVTGYIMLLSAAASTTAALAF